MIEIIVCMGSSCYSRGNFKNIELIKKYIEENNLKKKVILKGELCKGLCNKGPNIMINNKIYNNVDESSLIEILKYHFKFKING